MATMRDIVDGAAKRLGVIRSGESLDANDSADILQALNDMMGSWEGRGVNIAWSSDLALSGTFPLADKHKEGVKAMLAVRITDEFPLPVSAILARDASDGWNAIQADYILPDPIAVDLGLRNMPSQRRSI